MTTQFHGEVKMQKLDQAQMARVQGGEEKPVTDCLTEIGVGAAIGAIGGIGGALIGGYGGYLWCQYVS